MIHIALGPGRVDTPALGPSPVEQISSLIGVSDHCCDSRKILFDDLLQVDGESGIGRQVRQPISFKSGPSGEEILTIEIVKEDFNPVGLAGLSPNCGDINHAAVPKSALNLGIHVGASTDQVGVIPPGGDEA